MKKLSVISLAMLPVVFGGCGSEPEAKAPRRVKAMKVLDASSLSTSIFPGRATPGREVNLSFRVGGPLVELAASVGDRVEEGTLVARIDPTDYESAAKALEGQLQAAQATARRARTDLGRIEATFRDDPGATSQTARDRARQLRDSTAARVRAAQATFNGALDQLSYTSLKAPFGGDVVETYVENFEVMVPKQPVARIVDRSSIKFVVSVPENLIGYAPNVTNVEVSFDALPGIKVPAQIQEIGREATQATRTYPVTLVMSQPDGAEILPGMAGEAHIEAELPEGARQVGIQIPATAVFTQDDPRLSYVWLIDEISGTLQRRRVEPGGLSEFGVLIRSGLQAGERIVVAGVSLLSEGEQVVPLDDRSGDPGS